MISQSPNRPDLYGKKVLLIDPFPATREVRESILRNHGVEVHAAESLAEARFLWRPNAYHLILLDVRRQLPGEALEFYEQITAASSRQRFAFLVGPPVYLSGTWPSEVTAPEKEPQQWAETVQRFLTAA